MELKMVGKVVWKKISDFNCMIFNICMGIAK